MFNVNRPLAGSLALVATVLTIAAASPVRAETVSIATRGVDKAVLASRINRAADQVCGVAMPNERFEAARCRSQAVRAANAQLAAREPVTVQLASR